MLSEQDNELLTRVGRGTAMGELMRGYWLPALLSSEIEPDGRPVRVRLLGEDLVAFRDSGGRPGILAEHCPHRQASLYLGRNEQGGLRCVYHGWKFDTEGRCLDLPSEPPGSPMCQRIRARAYPCGERGGIVWAWLGEGQAPALPEFEWALVEPEQRYMSKRLLECNWAQALEGDIDSSHASFLHALLDKSAYSRYERSARARYIDGDGHPSYEVERRPWGLQIAARRAIVGSPDGYWRVAQYIVPFTTLPAPYEDELYRCNIWVPVDDLVSMTYVVDWHPSRAITQSELASRATGLTAHCHEFEPASPWRPKANRDNGYLYSAERQTSDNYSGIREIWAQDKAVVESMGPIMNRSLEHLGSSDRPIVEFRTLLLDLVKSKRPHGEHRNVSAMVRSASFVLGPQEDWRSAAREHVVSHPGMAPHPGTV